MNAGAGSLEQDRRVRVVGGQARRQKAAWAARRRRRSDGRRRAPPNRRIESNPIELNKFLYFAPLRAPSCHLRARLASARPTKFNCSNAPGRPASSPGQFGPTHFSRELADRRRSTPIGAPAPAARLTSRVRPHRPLATRRRRRRRCRWRPDEIGAPDSGRRGVRANKRARSGARGTPRADQITFDRPLCLFRARASLIFWTFRKDHPAASQRLQI